MRHKILSFVGIIVAFIIFAGALNGGEDEVASGSDKKAEAEKIYAVGDPVVADQVEVTILKVEEKSSVGSDFFVSEASEGGIYLAVQYSLKNNV